jgi:hypothetical protein
MTSRECRRRGRRSSGECEDVAVVACCRPVAKGRLGPIVEGVANGLEEAGTLIAAYFAAHNPPKSDVRMFVRVDDLEGVPKKGKKGHVM